MKKNLTIMLFVLLASVLAGCSSDDNVSSNSEMGFVGQWNLSVWDKGWAQHIIFQENEVICKFEKKGVLEVINNTSTDLSPFVNSGRYVFTVDAQKKEITISSDSKMTVLKYRFDGESLFLSKNAEADGSTYVFKK